MTTGTAAIPGRSSQRLREGLKFAAQCAANVLRPQAHASGLWEQKGGALRRLVMRGDGKGRGGECEGGRQGDLQSNRKSVQTAPMRAHRCNLVQMWQGCAQSG
jgi:hypothetical protein